MNMSELSFGCQTYPWKMGRRYAGDMPHMLAVAAQAGFQGMEAEIDMLGEYFDRPDALRALLEKNHLRFAALVLHQDWAHPQQTPAERALTAKAIAFAGQFPFAKLMLSHHAGDVPRDEGEALRVRRENLIACMQEAASAAAEAGIVACFHPNSAANSLFRTAEDYEVLFRLLPGTAIGWAPDVGHIENGGIDALALMRAHRDLIRHVHFKDRRGPGDWAVMGEGRIDYPAILAFLADTDYRGWVMVEDESPRAAADSDGVVALDGAYMRRVILGGNAQ